MKNANVLACIFLFFLINAPAPAQDAGLSRGSIPEALLRPGRGEASRYPADIVIGELGQGRATSAAFAYASSIAAGLLSGQMANPALAQINPALRENYLDALGGISARAFRLGGGREEPDGAVSFLVRFIGRDYGITGELFIRYITAQRQGEGAEAGGWTFDELLLDEARNHAEQQGRAVSRMDMLPYERFF